MTDKELIELAAKAGGINGLDFDYAEKEGFGYFGPRLPAMSGICAQIHRYWDPLRDDGDALRLAVALRIDVRHDEVGMKSFVYARTVFNDETHIGLSEIFDDESERLDRTRRAITRAAAQIGKEME